MDENRSWFRCRLIGFGFIFGFFFGFIFGFWIIDGFRFDHWLGLFRFWLLWLLDRLWLHRFWFHNRLRLWRFWWRRPVSEAVFLKIKLLKYISFGQIIETFAILTASILTLLRQNKR